MIPLRPYQAEHIRQIKERIRAGVRRLVVVAPTGSGKTVEASAIVLGALEKQRRTLFCAHRRELIRQTTTKLFRVGIPCNDIGVVMAGVPARARGSLFGGPLDLLARLRAQGHTDPQIDAEFWETFAARRPQAPIQVASIDTARGRDLGDFDLVIFDEAHRSLSPSYQAIADRYKDAVLLGLTATPYRTDNRGLGLMYQGLVPPVLTARQLAEQGFLVAPRMFGAPVESLPDVSEVTMSGGDYNADELAEVTDDPRLIGDAVTHWGQRAERLRTVVFAASVQHSRHVVGAFKAAGVRAEHLDGSTPTEERDAILSRLEKGETTVVSNYGVLTEGWDMPIVAVAVLLRHTASRALAKQMMGRVLRPHSEKPFTLILDHARVVMNHEGPLAEEEYSLESPKKRRGPSVPATKTCPACFAIIAAGARTCPENKIDGTPCGHVFSVASAEEPEQEDGSLVEIEDVPTPIKREAWDRLCAERGKRKPGWVYRQYFELFKMKPPRSFKVPLRESEKPENDDEIMAEWRGVYQAGYRRGDSPEQARGHFRRVRNFWPNRAMQAEQRTWIAEQEAASAERAEAETARMHAAADLWHAGKLEAAREALAARGESAPRWRVPTGLPVLAEVAA